MSFASEFHIPVSGPVAFTAVASRYQKNCVCIYGLTKRTWFAFIFYFVLLPPRRRLCFNLYMFICLFVCSQDYATTKSYDFHKIQWKGGSWATEETISFGGNSDHLMLGLGLG